MDRSPGLADDRPDRVSEGSAAPSTGVAEADRRLVAKPDHRCIGHDLELAKGGSDRCAAISFWTDNAIDADDRDLGVRTDVGGLPTIIVGPRVAGAGRRAGDQQPLDVFGPANGTLAGKNRQRGRHRQIGFFVGSVDAAVKAALEAGGTLLSKPATWPYGRRAAVADPDGHRVELSEDPFGRLTGDYPS